MSRAFLWALVAVFTLGAALLLWRLRIAAEEPLHVLDAPVLIERAPKTSGAPEASDTREAYVYDNARLLDDNQLRHMAKFLKFVHGHLDMEMVVVTTAKLPAGKNIVEWGAVKVEELQIGAKTSNGRRGLLFGIALEEALVRMEVGYELEDLYTDAVVSYYENQMMKPYFAHNQVNIGLEATVEHFVSRALRQDRSPLGEEALLQEQEALARSGGGGATAEAPIDKPETHLIYRATEEERAYYSPQPTPWETMNREYEAGCRRIVDTTLPLYTEESRKRYRFQIITAAQMGRPCNPESRLYTEKGFVIQGNLAVVFHPYVIRNRGLGYSFFLRNAEGLWELDRATTMEYVRYNFTNKWGFFCGYPDPYMFAFQHWCFDKNGWPYNKVARTGFTYHYVSGKYVRNNFGDFSTKTKEALKRYPRQRVLITRVDKGGPADRAGLQVGDVPLEINGRSIERTGDIRLAYDRRVRHEGLEHPAPPEEREPSAVFTYLMAPQISCKVARGSEIVEMTIDIEWHCPDNDPPHEAVPADEAPSIHEGCSTPGFKPIDWLYHQ
jgi:uncharacterized membrane protein YgcG